MTLTVPDVDALADALDAQVAEEHRALYRPRWNAAPGDSHFIAWRRDGSRFLVPARWGFTGPGGSLLINARAETAAELHSFRDSLARRRCVVAADGFYEWEGPPADRRPRWFHPPGGGLLLLAGLWTLREGAPAFTVLTTEANALVAPVHDRMPAILRKGELEAWLGEDPAAAASLLVPAPLDALVATEVSQRVNSVANDDPACLLPAAPRPPRPKQLGLF